MAAFLSSAYLKIFLNYLQIFSIIGTLNLKWDKSITSLFNCSKIATGSVLQVISFECIRLGKTNIPTVYFIPLITSFFPWIMLVFIIFIWVLVQIVKRQNSHNIFENFSTIINITIFSMQPSIINALVNMISCIEIDKDSFYVANYTDEKCWTNQHYQWIFQCFVPSFFFYGVFMPLSIFLYMKINEKNLYEMRYLKKIGFLLTGYKRKKFYW